MSEILLSCQSLCKDYVDGEQSLNILNKVSFDINTGQKVAILGASGSGKSTLLHILGTLDKPDAGEVLFAGQSLISLNKKQQAAFRNQSLGFVYQFHHLLPEFSALENVAMPLLIRGEGHSQALAKAKQLLDRVELSHRSSHRPYQLSGGERQRVAIARALVNQPKVVLADEPTGNLDDANTASIYTLLDSINRDYATTFVVVTHDQSLAQKMDRVLHIERGQISELGLEHGRNRSDQQAHVQRG